MVGLYRQIAELWVEQGLGGGAKTALQYVSFKKVKCVLKHKLFKN